MINQEHFLLETITGSSKTIASSIAKLLSGMIVAVKINNFYKENEIDSIVNNCNTIGFRWFDQLSLGYIGFSISEHLSLLNGKTKYFEKINQIYHNFDFIFGQKKKPTDKLLHLLKNSFKCGIAFDTNYQQFYAPGIIEARITGRPIHIDGSRQTSVLSGCQCQPINELSLVLFLQAPEKGGELQIFNKEEEPSDQYYELTLEPKDREKCLEKICHNRANILIKPNAGDLVIFANCYYHKVLPSEGEKHRMAYLTSIYLIDSNLIIWV